MFNVKKTYRLKSNYGPFSPGTKRLYYTNIIATPALVHCE